MDNLDRLNEKLLKRERIFGYTVYLPSTYVIADYLPAGVDYICIAAGCGEDANCTAATLGAIMGVILGASKLSEKWLSPVGDEIKTCSLNLMDDLIKIPKTVTELTERTCRLMSAFMVGHFDMFASGAEISLSEGEALFDHPIRKWTIEPYTFRDEYPERFETFTGENAIMKVQITAEDGISIKEGETRQLRLHAENVSGFVGNQLWLKLRWILPEGWSIDTGARTALFLNQYHCGEGHAYSAARITAGPVTEPVMTVVLVVSAQGRPGCIYIPVQFVCAV